MKTTKKDFELFKKECDKWLKKLGLDYFKIIYKWENLDNYNIDGGSNTGDHVGYATISLDTDIQEEHTPFDVKETAQHEVIHLLPKRLEELAYQRHATRTEIYNATEELVNKLVYLLNNNMACKKKKK